MELAAILEILAYDPRRWPALYWGRLEISNSNELKSYVWSHVSSVYGLMVRWVLSSSSVLQEKGAEL